MEKGPSLRKVSAFSVIVWDRDYSSPTTLEEDEKERVRRGGASSTGHGAFTGNKGWKSERHHRPHSHGRQGERGGGTVQTDGNKKSPDLFSYSARPPLRLLLVQISRVGTEKPLTALVSFPASTFLGRRILKFMETASRLDQRFLK